MRYTWLLFSIFVLVSCGQDQEVEVVDIGELQPEAQYIEKEEELEEQEASQDSLTRTLIHVFGLEGLNMLEQPSHTLFPDRIRHEQRLEKHFELNGLTFSFFAWEYADSVLSSTALYNWLDCFGDDCKEVSWSSTENISRVESIRILKGQNHLVYLTSQERTDFKVLDTWLNVLFPEEEWRTEILQPKGRAVIWQ